VTSWRHSVHDVMRTPAKSSNSCSRMTCRTRSRRPSLSCILRHSRSYLQHKHTQEIRIIINIMMTVIINMVNLLSMPWSTSSTMLSLSIRSSSIIIIKFHLQHNNVQYAVTFRLNILIDSKRNKYFRNCQIDFFLKCVHYQMKKKKNRKKGTKRHSIVSFSNG
jgi:hypothetical protein